MMFSSFKSKKMYYTCDYCSENVSVRNYYLFKIIGQGKHDGKIVCNKCLEKSLKKK